MMGIAQIANRIPDSFIVVIVGRRGSGKDVTGASLTREMQKRQRCTVLSTFNPREHKLPEDWELMRGLRIKPRSIAFLPDAQLEVYADDWQEDEIQAFVKFLSHARHSDSSVVMSTQNSGLITRKVMSLVDAIIFKAPSAMQDQFERPEMRRLTLIAAQKFGMQWNEEKMEFEDVSGMSEVERWEMAWVFTDRGSFVVRGIRKPGFWTEEMSKQFGSVEETRGFLSRLPI